MKNNLINKKDFSLWLSCGVLAACFCLQYYVGFGNMIIRWNSEDFSYCYLVPPLFVYLVYINRWSLKVHELRPSLIGFVLLFFSGLLYLGGNLGSIETLTYLALWVAVIGVALLLAGGRMVKALAFPFLILAFIVPLPPFLNKLFTFKLKLISSALSVEMMHLGGLSVFREGNIIDLGLTQLQVVDACSGLRYVYPLLLTGLVSGYLFHRRWWERVIMALATIPISVFANALRIAITGYLTINVSPQAADGFFHGFSGWLIFMVSLVFLAIVSWLLKLSKSRLAGQEPAQKKETNPNADSFDPRNIRQSYLWIASALFLAFWGVSTVLTSAHIKPPRKTFEEFPTVIGDWQGERSYVSEKILDFLWADDYVQIHFSNTRTGDMILFFVPYYEYQKTRHTAHSPVSCLLGGGFASRSREIIQSNFPPPFGEVEIRQMVLEKDGELLLSNYWFQQRGRIVVSEYRNKWYLFWDSVTKRRTDGALVRLEMPLTAGRDIEAAQAVLDSFTQELMKILPEYVPG
jgi:exosortase D (VPLPA-CTERM-specific)